MMMNHWVFLSRRIMAGTAENIKTGPKSDARIRTLWEALAKKSQNQRSRFYRVPERGGKAASQMGSQMISRWASITRGACDIRYACYWYPYLSRSSSMFAAYTCISVSWNPLLNGCIPKGDVALNPHVQLVILHRVTMCYHLCLFENHPLCTHWIPLMVFLAELSVFTVNGCWWTMVSNSVSSGSGLMLAFWTIASVGRGGWNTGMGKIVAGAKKDSTLCFWYEPPSKSIYIVFFWMPVLFLVQWCNDPEG